MKNLMPLFKIYSSDVEWGDSLSRPNVLVAVPVLRVLPIPLRDTTAVKGGA